MLSDSLDIVGIDQHPVQQRCVWADAAPVDPTTGATSLVGGAHLCLPWPVPKIVIALRGCIVLSRRVEISETKTYPRTIGPILMLSR